MDEENIPIKESMKGILDILKEALAVKQQAINNYAVQCAVEMKIDIGKYALDISVAAFVPRVNVVEQIQPKKGKIHDIARSPNGGKRDAENLQGPVQDQTDTAEDGRSHSAEPI